MASSWEHNNEPLSYLTNSAIFFCNRQWTPWNYSVNVFCL